MNKKILIASNLGIYSHGMGFDSYLYQLLDENSYDVTLAMCDGVMDACQMSKFSRVMPIELATNGQKKLCESCHEIGCKRVNDLRNVIKLSSYLDNSNIYYDRLVNDIEVDLIRGYKYKGINVGEHAYASAVRYFANLNFLGESYGARILRLYLIAAMKIADIYFNILIKLSPSLIISHHGIYTPQGIVVEVAKKLNIDLITWIKTYRKDTFLFSWGDSYHHEMQNDNQEYKNLNFSPEVRRTVLDYLSSRRSGVNESIHFNVNPEKVDSSKVPEKFDLLLTSVFWDAQVHYRSNLFSDQADWILETIGIYANHPNLGSLVIRIHPAEVTGFIESRDKAIDRIIQKYPSLPSNVLIINSDSKLSTYDLIDRSSCVIVYNTKTAIEAAAMGKPVLVSGDSWLKNCDFVLAPKSELEYINIILKNLHRTYKFSIIEAQKYFYHFYFRRMLEFPAFVENKKDFNYEKSLRHGYINKIMERSEMTLLDAIKSGKNIFINRNYYLW